MIISLNCKIERIDGVSVEDGIVDVCVEDIALLRVDAVRFGDFTYGEIVTRSGFRTLLMGRAEDWVALQKAVRGQ